jgi:hypothetical protein
VKPKSFGLDGAPFQAGRFLANRPDLAVAQRKAR